MSKTTAGIIIIVVIVAVFVGIMLWIGNVARENTYCDNWSERLDIIKEQYQADWTTTETQYNQLNEEIFDYNRQCAF
jgi:uncharacterized membrane protein